MYDIQTRWIALVAVIAAMLNACYHYELGNVSVSLYFLVTGVLLTAVTDIAVRRRII